MEGSRASRIKLDYLKPDQVQRLFQQVLKLEGPLEASWQQALAGLTTLTPGDFAAVVRCCRLSLEPLTPERLVQ
jgi:hypothetical protein